jgi:hypothetical protein
MIHELVVVPCQDMGGKGPGKSISPRHYPFGGANKDVKRLAEFNLHCTFGRIMASPNGKLVPPERLTDSVGRRGGLTNNNINASDSWDLCLGLKTDNPY